MNFAMRLMALAAAVVLSTSAFAQQKVTLRYAHVGRGGRIADPLRRRARQARGREDAGPRRDPGVSGLAAWQPRGDGGRRAHRLDPDGPPRLLFTRPHREGRRGLQRAVRVPRSGARHEGDERGEFAGDEGDQREARQTRAAFGSSRIFIAALASSLRVTPSTRRRTCKARSSARCRRRSGIR